MVTLTELAQFNSGLGGSRDEESDDEQQPLSLIPSIFGLCEDSKEQEDGQSVSSNESIAERLQNLQAPSSSPSPPSFPPRIPRPNPFAASFNRQNSNIQAQFSFHGEGDTPEASPEQIPETYLPVLLDEFNNDLIPEEKKVEFPDWCFASQYSQTSAEANINVAYTNLNTYVEMNFHLVHRNTLAQTAQLIYEQSLRKHTKEARPWTLKSIYSHYTEHVVLPRISMEMEIQTINKAMSTLRDNAIFQELQSVNPEEEAKRARTPRRKKRAGEQQEEEDQPLPKKRKIDYRALSYYLKLGVRRDAIGRQLYPSRPTSYV